MKTIVIDTNTYSFLCHGQEDVARLLSEQDIVYVPSVVIGELEAGFRNGTRYLQNKAALNRFLSIACVRVADVNARIAEIYGVIYAQLKARGTIIPLNDVWIASTALALKSPLVSYDQHFTKVEGLDLILKEVRA